MNDHFLIRRFNYITLFVLSILLSFSCAWAYLSNQSLIRQASIERANYIAGALSDTLIHAMDVGIPFDSMRGVNTLLQVRANENENIHYIAIKDLDGKAIWQAYGGVQEAKPIGVMVNVRFRGQKIAYVEVSVYPTSILPMIASAIFLQIILCIMAYIACYEAIIFSLGRGIILREQAKLKMQQAVMQGQLDTVIVGQNKVGSDSVLYGMVQQIRRLNEKIWRIRRLTASLLATEPDEKIRANLNATLTRLESQLVFADRKPKVVILSGLIIDARWLCFLCSVAVESLLQAMVPDSIEWMSPLFVLFSAAGALTGFFISQKLAIKRSSQFLISLSSLIMIVGILTVGLLPLTLYSVFARFIIYVGATILFYGCYSIVNQVQERQLHWSITFITGGVLLGRTFSLLALEWFGSNALVVYALLLVISILFLINKFSLRQIDNWRISIEKTVHTPPFSPTALCSGILSGLLFSFALMTFVFNEGYGNEMTIILSWFFLGLGSYLGYQLREKWMRFLWPLALISILISIFEQQQTATLNLLFCFSLSALEWQVRRHTQENIWFFNWSDWLGVAAGAIGYLIKWFYFPAVNILFLFLPVVLIIGVMLVYRGKRARRKEFDATAR